jgi:hypothetical protein
MFVLGHVGFAFGIFFLVMYFKPEWQPKFDVRWLALGIMLPDIIDKTIGLLIFRQYIDNGRIYAHSLLFSFAILFIALYFRDRWTISVSFGTWTHLAFDRMWEVPETLFWPAFRWDFPQIGFDPSKWIEMLLTNPYIYISEIIGAGIMLFLFFYYGMHRWEKFKRVFQTGNFN